jgi:hypothetical protein
MRGNWVFSWCRLPRATDTQCRHPPICTLSPNGILRVPSVPAMLPAVTRSRSAGSRCHPKRWTPISQQTRQHQISMLPLHTGSCYKPATRVASRLPFPQYTAKTTPSPTPVVACQRRWAFSGLGHGIDDPQTPMTPAATALTG